MATLVREAPPAHSSPNNVEETSNVPNLASANTDLATTVPTPFPDVRGSVKSAPLDERHDRNVVESDNIGRISNQIEGITTDKRVDEQMGTGEQQPSVLPSISLVESSALITLNTLLSTTHSTQNQQWTTILPPRRHSMPASALHAASAGIESDGSLQILLDNLRNAAGDEMIQLGQSGNATEGKNSLLNELQERVNTVATTLDETDARLARALVSLLAHSHRLTQLQPDSLSTPLESSGLEELGVPDWESSNIYDTLDRQVSNLKARRADEEETSTRQLDDGARTRVERALLWNHIDEDLEVVSRLCRQRIAAADPFADELGDDAHTIGRERAISPGAPPEYDHADFELPEYQHRASYDYPPSFKEKEKRRVMPDDTASVSTIQQRFSMADEKMRLDLEAVTMAIDRLYMVAPQLHNQRVELRAKKREEMERAAKAATTTSTRGKSLTPSGQRSRSGSGVASGEEKLNRSGSGTKGKGRMKEGDDLESMLSLIGRASSRRMNDQAVTLSEEMRDRMRKARMEDDENRRKFITQLATHSDAGRLHNQDALLPNPQKLRDSVIKDPEALLTLPEFIKEAIPQQIQESQERDRLEDPNALLTLPEFVKESIMHPQVHMHSNPQSPSISRRGSEKFSRADSENERKGNGSEGEGKTLRKSKSGRLRSKSVSSASAAGAWLMGKSWSRQSVAAIPPTPSASTISTSNSQAGLDISFVAEYQDNLNVVVLLFKVITSVSTSSMPEQLVVEVVPGPSTSTDGNSSYGDTFIVKHGASWSPPLFLPTKVALGKFTVPPTGEHYEIKLSTPQTEISPSGSGQTVLLDAAELTNICPTSLVCASCSLPLVHTVASSKSNVPSEDPFNPPATIGHEEPESQRLVYRDLPSEYWTELVDAWMCHHDQALNARIAQNAKEGSWPTKDECLVGGSYLLVDESAIVKSSVKVLDGKDEDDWKHVRCICGALVGRCQLSPVSKTLAYRLPKYSIRPVASNARPIRIPMSAYVVEDMIELSQAHATYRFVVCDEEEDKPRLLLWLFKPNMRLSYSSPTSTLIPRSGSVMAAKILFKIIGPGGTLAYDMKTTLERHPNFAHAEQLYYPIDICRRLAGLLRESHSTYPSNRRTMSGLDAGWLQRST